MLIERVPDSDKVIWSTHATTIWAWRWPTRWRASSTGARQIECTINGIGERAGNAALEES
jgi:2-isopropylmalate synthase